MTDRRKPASEPCPFCGRQISTHGLAQTSHRRAHVRAGEAVEVEYPGCAVRRGRRTRRQSDTRVFMTPTHYEEHKDRIAASRGYLVKLGQPAQARPEMGSEISRV